MSNTQRTQRLRTLALTTLVLMLSLILILTVSACDEKDKGENEDNEVEFVDSRIANIIAFVLSDDKPDDYTFEFWFEKQNNNTLETCGEGYIGHIGFYYNETAGTDIMIMIYDTAEHANESLDKYSHLQDDFILSVKDNLVVMEARVGLFDTIKTYNINQCAISDKKLNFIKGALEDKLLKNDELTLIAGSMTKNYFNIQAFDSNDSQVVQYSYEDINSDYLSLVNEDDISQIGTKYTSDSYIKQEEGTYYQYLKTANILQHKKQIRR